jgi:hypothetical protein
MAFEPHDIEAELSVTRRLFGEAHCGVYRDRGCARIRDNCGLAAMQPNFGEDRPDRDADVALIIAEGTADWRLVGTLAELAYEVFLESGILIQRVPVSLAHWRHPVRARITGTRSRRLGQ